MLHEPPATVQYFLQRVQLLWCMHGAVTHANRRCLCDSEWRPTVPEKEDDAPHVR